MLEPFQLPFVQRGLIEVLILSVPAGLLGTWIVLRGLAFFSHAVGTAAFPGLVLADGLGFAAPLGALAAALAFSAGNSALRRRDGERAADSVVAIVLAGCLAAGVILASDVFGTGADVETLLFGSLLLVGRDDVVLAALAAAAALAATLLVGSRWLAGGFDPGLGASASSRQGPVLDGLLLGLLALATTAALSTIGALLVAALFVLPALTARLYSERLASWQIAAVALAAAEGTFGLWLSVKTDAPPGATIACVAGAVFGVTALARATGARPRALRHPAAILAALVVVPALIAAAAGGAPGSAGGRPEVLATTTQIGDWVREVGGSAISVDQVLRPNTDPHDYEPRPADVQAAARARLAFASGDGLDGWAGKIVADSGGDAPVVLLGDHVPHPLREAGGGSSTDPHWWHDPRNAEAAVREIARRLAAAVPSHRALFAARARAYERRLRALDRGIARCMRSIPAARRRLVTDHDAFAYFARRYGIEVVGALIPAQASEAQPSARDLSHLAATVEAQGVAAIFPESAVSPKVAEAIARQTGTEVGGRLYGDSLGPAGSAGATYIGMERANADAMARGFTGGRRGCR
jgi:ABC-type Zn uptake system ZnuABC Zn-binding protein ZnuA/ABC-type Mn2+/Zn2+ transport system permease subunit